MTSHPRTPFRSLIDKELFMSSAAESVHPSSTTDENGTVVHFGITRPDKFGRIAIYTPKVVHLANTYRHNPYSETLFQFHPFVGIQAIAGDADEATLDLVYRLAYYTNFAYDKHIGIRFAASDNSDYATSKIVLYKKADVDIEEICREIAGALYGAAVAVKIDLVDSETPSVAESKDFQDYNLPN
jgi:hypothetical protein